MDFIAHFLYKLITWPIKAALYIFAFLIVAGIFKDFFIDHSPAGEILLAIGLVIWFLVWYKNRYGEEDVFVDEDGNEYTLDELDDMGYFDDLEPTPTKNEKQARNRNSSSIRSEEGVTVELQLKSGAWYFLRTTTEGSVSRDVAASLSNYSRTNKTMNGTGLVRAVGNKTGTTYGTWSV